MSDIRLFVKKQEHASAVILLFCIPYIAKRTLTEDEYLILKQTNIKCYINQYLYEIDKTILHDQKPYNNQKAFVTTIRKDDEIFCKQIGKNR